MWSRARFAHCCLLFAIISLLSPQQAHAAAAVPSARAALSSDTLPLVFAPNLGQVSPNVRFVAHDLGASLYFARQNVVMAIAGVTDARDARDVHDQPPASANLLIRWQGANPEVQLASAEVAIARLNYFIGSDPSQWRRNVVAYREVVYRSLYSGIDLFYTGAAGSLQGSYVIAPGADPLLIRWRVSGAHRPQIDAGGNLIVRLKNNQTVIDEAPLAWQIVAGQRLPVAAELNIYRDGSIGYALPHGYDPALPLVIAPRLTYATYWGGADEEYVTDMAVDRGGSIYLVGRTFSKDFPLANALRTTMTDSGLFPIDGFISKFSADGKTLLYSTYIGGAQQDIINGIALDDNNDIYVTGRTSSTDFPTVGAFQNFVAGSDGFVMKLNAAGTAIAYSTYLGSYGGYATALTVDKDKNAYVVGQNAVQFPTTPGAFQPAIGIGASGGFVAKIDPLGAKYLFASFLGRQGGGWGPLSVAVDDIGNVYVTGDTDRTDHPLQSPLQATKKGITDATITKIAPDGSALLFSTYLGGDGAETGYKIVVDAAQNVYVVGATNSTTFPTAAALQPTYGGGLIDAFVVKLAPPGDSLTYATYLGGNDPERAYDALLDPEGNLYVVGFSGSADFPVVNPIQAQGAGYNDGFVTQLNPQGSAILFSTYLGGSLEDIVQAAALGADGVLYVAGETYSADFPVAAALQAKLTGENDVFLVRIDAEADATAKQLYLPYLRR